MNIRWNKEKLTVEASKYDSRIKFQRQNPSAYATARNRGILDEICQHMKKSKPNWPLADLLKYHEIKDSYFLSKNIDILHIKEKEWKENKVLCIKKCLIFLS